MCFLLIVHHQKDGMGEPLKGVSSPLILLPDPPPANTYNSLPVVGNYPEPVAASNQESEVRY